MTADTNVIYPFTFPKFPPHEQVGGKALALMQMTAAGMPIPPGLVLTVRFFEPWLDLVNQSQAWQEIVGEEEIGPAARALQASCSALQLTSEQRRELHTALADFRAQHGECLYAVRSSSPEEDLEGASFAGGYETTLGVRLDDIEAAIRHSFSSSFNERVFVYKKEHGFLLDQPRIAMIIQRQVDADAAGVAFSVNPLNNCYDEVVINANYGLGESVVAGEADTDLFVIDKIRGEIIETRIGSKRFRTRLNTKGGTVKSVHQDQAQTAITPAQALELTRLVEKVEGYFQKPVDIEWALASGQFLLLQARPITTYLPLPPEMITAPGQPKRLYANSTLIEQGLQEPLSVLGTDFLGLLLNKVGGPVAEGAVGLDGVTFTAGGGYYMNISHAMMMGMQNAALAPGSMGDPRVMEILDGIDMKQYTGGQLPAKLKAMRGQMMFKVLPMLKDALEAYIRPEHVLNRYQTALPEENRKLDKFKVKPSTASPGINLHKTAVALTDLLTFFYGDHGIPMILAGQMAQRRIKGLFKVETPQAQDHLVNLGIALPGNKTTQMGEAMYALADSAEVKRFDNAAAFLSALRQGSITPEFIRRWEDFLTEFGFRCPGEIDPATPRPYEDPARLFEQLKNMPVDGSRSFFETARAKREAAYHALYQVALKKGKSIARAFERSYKRWLTFGGYRETPKHYVIKVIDLFRRQALAIGRLFVATGRLDTPQQIFDLTIADIDIAQADSALDLRALAHERSVLIHKIRRSKLAARILDSRGKIFYPPRKAVTDGALRGVPISPGVVQGRVKVLRFADEKPLLPGEILVARATDPGWTPLFINAKGIILEIGGALQHGAVVAREYGIPCVSGLDDATQLMQDRQWVEVDGSNGIVRIAEDQARS